MTTTMKSSRTQVFILLLAGLLAQPVTAGVIPGRWEKVSTLEMTSPITAELKNGDRIRGQFRRLSPSALELRSRAGRAVIPKSDIRDDYHSLKGWSGQRSRHWRSDWGWTCTRGLQLSSSYSRWVGW